VKGHGQRWELELACDDFSILDGEFPCNDPWTSNSVLDHCRLNDLLIQRDCQVIAHVPGSECTEIPDGATFHLEADLWPPRLFLAHVYLVRVEIGTGELRLIAGVVQGELRWVKYRT